MPKELVQATASMWLATEDGRGRLVNYGDLFAADDPIVKANPERFATAEQIEKLREPVEFGPTEQATAAPGEKRSATSRTKREP